MSTSTPEVIVANMKKRYSGVMGTINVLLPVQSRKLHIGFVGTDISGAQMEQQKHATRFTRLTTWQAIKLSFKRLPDGRKRIWHVRRDPEMMLTVFLRNVVHAPVIPPSPWCSPRDRCITGVVKNLPQ